MECCILWKHAIPITDVSDLLKLKPISQYNTYSIDLFELSQTLFVGHKKICNYLVESNWNINFLSEL